MLKKILSISIVILFFLGILSKTPLRAADSGGDVKSLIDIMRLLFGGSGDTSFDTSDQNSNSGVTTAPHTPTTPSNPYSDFPSSPTNTLALKSEIVKLLDRHPGNINVYKQAGQITGVEWTFLAGIHYRECGMCGDGSLVSGRLIGAREPDIPRSACSSARQGQGIPIPIAGGCGFRTLLDSAIYAANDLKRMAHGDLNGYKQMVMAAGYYNGKGNRNCGRTPYKSCPPYFANEDHNYALNEYDQRHNPMYIVYCADHVRCHPPKTDARPGALTVAKIVAGLGK